MYYVISQKYGQESTSPGWFGYIKSLMDRKDRRTPRKPQHKVSPGDHYVVIENQDSQVSQVLFWHLMAEWPWLSYSLFKPKYFYLFLCFVFICFVIIDILFSESSPNKYKVLHVFWWFFSCIELSLPSSALAKNSSFLQVFSYFYVFAVACLFGVAHLVSVTCITWVEGCCWWGFLSFEVPLPLQPQINTERIILIIKLLTNG